MIFVALLRCGKNSVICLSVDNHLGKREKVQFEKNIITNFSTVALAIQTEERFAVAVFFGSVLRGYFLC